MSKSIKSVFITGAATGIGRATALRFAGEGYFVGLYDVNLLGVTSLAKELGSSRAVSGLLDVTDYRAFEAALKSFVKAAGGRLDVLVNNAGILSCGAFEALPAERQHALIDVNAKGVSNGCLAAYPYLKITRGARVINMASASAIYGAPGFAVYSATKFFVRGLTEALNVEWGGQGIAVSDVMPLFVDTPMVANLNERPKSIARLGIQLNAQDIAAVIWQAANDRKPRVHYYPGAQAKALVAMQRWVPERLNRLSTKLLTGY